MVWNIKCIFIALDLWNIHDAHMFFLHIHTHVVRSHRDTVRSHALTQTLTSTPGYFANITVIVFVVHTLHTRKRWWHHQQQPPEEHFHLNLRTINYSLTGERSAHLAHHSRMLGCRMRFGSFFSLLQYLHVTRGRFSFVHPECECFSCVCVCVRA